MLKIRLKYLSIFLAFISLLSFEALIHPLFAISRRYGNVLLVSAFVEVNGTAPGILATQ